MAKFSEVEDKWTFLPNEFLQDDTISYELKGLIAEAMSRPCGMKQLQRKGIAGKRKVERIFAEGQSKGYIYRDGIDGDWHMADHRKTKRQWQKNVNERKSL